MTTERYLGTGYLEADERPLTGVIPDHLPKRLAICLWDFSWYTQAGQGEPYGELRQAFEQTRERGFNTVRICAAPLLIYGSAALAEMGLKDHHRLSTQAVNLEFDGLGTAPDGGLYGRRTRWYDAPGGYSLNLKERLFELFTLAAEFDITVIVSSWEYQQSPSFAALPTWYTAINEVDLERRYEFLAKSLNLLHADLAARSLSNTVAFTELHNEIDFSILPAMVPSGSAQLEWLRECHPDQLFTASYGKPPHLAMFTAPPGLDVAQYHVYSYGVLDALQKLIDIRSEGTAQFPNEVLSALLRDDAPTFAQYGRPAPWKMAATVVTDQMVYGYDWIDPTRWDDWLNENYPRFEEVMLREIESRALAVSRWARHTTIPWVVGEGWVGYTPLLGTFEEGPIGCRLAQHGITTALDAGAWGTVVGSNAAPHHPLWQQDEWLRKMTALIRDQ